jgi:cell division GTPase FtsZ
VKEERKIYYQINYIGLGGAGCNILEQMLKSESFLEFIANSDIKLNAMAIDVADGDINELKNTYEELIKKLTEKGIPKDKVFLKATTIKFSSPDVLFDFLQKYPQYIRANEGRDIPNYRMWIDNKIKIPNLAGGVGRMRSLAKAVYALNYYHFAQLQNFLEEFLNRVSTSTVQPIIFLIYGLGGGTGSGIVYDLAVHIKKKIGGGIPIISLAVLPSNADDSLAKGPSPYLALNEFKEIFNLDKNPDNPLTASFFLPLQVAVTETKEGTLTFAKQQIDEEILNIVKLLYSFDMADMLADIGVNRNLKQNYVNLLGFLKVRYPIEDYIKASEVYLKRLDLLRNMIEEKRKFFNAANQYLSYLYDNGKEFFKIYQVNIGEPVEDVDKKILEIVKINSRFDVDVQQTLKTLQKYYIEEFVNLYEPLLKSLKFPQNSIESMTLERVVETLNYIQKMASVDFDINVFENNINECQNSIQQSRFSSKQLELLDQIIAFLRYSTEAIRVYQKYYIIKYFLEDLSARTVTVNPEKSKEFREIINEEMIALIRYMNTVTADPNDEKRSIATYAGGFQTVKKRINEKINGIKMTIDQLQEEISRRKLEVEEINKELKKAGIFSGGKKERLRKRLGELNAQMTEYTEKLREKQKELENLNNIITSINTMLSYSEVTGTLWRMLNNYLNLEKEYNNIISNAVKSSYFFEKILDLSEEERLKIIALMLSGVEKEQISSPDTIREIVDQRRFKESLKGTMRLFTSPSFFGVKNYFKTDTIWAIISTPMLWDNEMQEELKNQLAQYLSVSASTGISIRPIKPVEPWTIEFLIVLAKGRPEDLDVYEIIQQNAMNYTPEELILFQSYKVEEI